MPDNPEPTHSFNLWTEPWITLERPGGGVDQMSAEQTLLHAHKYRCLYEPSPLVVVGIQRLLTAILQFSLRPESNADLKTLWKNGKFPEQAIIDFGKSYAHRFDLFSKDAPFLQTADLPLCQSKDIKPVSYLAPEIPTGTAVTHFRHGSEDSHVFCPVCAARGLICIPPFATTGGSGIKPSINGVPPIYILPGGQTLFESLVASLLRQEWQPQIASRINDNVWWVREPLVGKSAEVREVGYLHSLTFTARRIRLHPQRVDAQCTRCGGTCKWGIRTMIFEMGESRPKDLTPWMDPFAAYRINEGKPPVPVRPVLGKATWREFAALFLREKPGESGKKLRVLYIRPTVLDQIAELELDSGQATYPFRCVGIRTDMKAKVFEWIDAGFEVPPAMLRDDTAGFEVRETVEFAGECARVIGRVFREKFGGKSSKSERNKGIRLGMGNAFWNGLADPFRQYVLDAAVIEHRKTARQDWADTVIQQGLRVFIHAADSLGDDAVILRSRAEGEKDCNIRLFKIRKEFVYA